MSLGKGGRICGGLFAGGGCRRRNPVYDVLSSDKKMTRELPENDC